jgi:hypothetical protein
MYGLHYQLVTERRALKQVLDNGYGNGPRLIEVRTNSHEDYRRQGELMAAIIKTIK